MGNKVAVEAGRMVAVAIDEGVSDAGGNAGTACVFAAVQPVSAITTMKRKKEDFFHTVLYGLIVNSLV